MVDWYLRVSATSGPAFVASWTNADVTLAALAVFAVFFVLAAVLVAPWPTDVALLALVVGGVMVAWPFMVAMAIAAAVLAAVVSILHSVVAPERSARIEAEAEAKASAAVADFARDLGVPDRKRGPP